MAASLKQFIRSLSASGLMTADEVRAFLDGLPSEKRPDNARELAKELFRQKRLTRFQTQALYQGKTRGLVLGNYVVLDKLGRGGMGQVYKARHRLMKRVVALKVLPLSATRSERAVRRFHREVEAAAKLSHPNVVTAYDADEAEGIHFLVMECVEGRDLASLVRRHGRLPVGKAVDYTIQAAKGLEYAHSQGVIHRDIKPSNLVLDSHGTVKVLDMGLARINEVVGPADSTPEESLTGTGRAMGTVDYMPPEQAENTKAADYRADIYSLGCTLFDLLTGHPVYQRDTVVAKLLAHQQDPIPSLLDERDDAPEKLDRVFVRMAAKAPADRYQSMTEVIEELEGCRKALYDRLQPTVTFQGKAMAGGGVHETAPGEIEETPADESLPLDLPVVSPVDEFLRTHRGGSKGQIIVGSIVAGATLVVLLLLAVILKIRTPDGTLVVEVNQPHATVTVLDEHDGVEITRRNDSGRISIAVEPGKHRLNVEKDGFRFFTRDFTIQSGGSERIGVWLEPLEKPTAFVLPPAVARFDEAQPAKQQQVWAFSEPENLGPTVNSSSDDLCPELSADGLTLLFYSDRPGGQGDYDLWVCRRSSPDGPFGEPVNLGPVVNSSSSDCHPELSADGLTLLFGSTRPGGEGWWDLWMCRRSSPDEPFAGPVNLGPRVNSRTYEGCPELSADGLTLLFGSGRSGGKGLNDLWLCRRSSPDEPFAGPVNLSTTVNSSLWDDTPALAADGLTLLFSSERPGGRGGKDLWMCRRSSPDQPFAGPLNLGPMVNTSSDEMGPELSADGLTLLFDSDRPGGEGKHDLWMCRITPRPPEPAKKTSDSP